MLRHRDEVGEMCHVVGDDRGRAKHCFFFMAVKDVRNGDPRRIHFYDLGIVTVLVNALLFYDHDPQEDWPTQPCTVIPCRQCCHRVQDSFLWP